MFIDLRSDTVTQPTEEMRAAMAQAEVGDDVYGEDPTVNRLEAVAAERMGKEAGLFVASGTMANLVAILTHCQRGDEALMGDVGHTFLFEVGGVSALGGVMVHAIPNQPDGTIALDELKASIRPEDIHQPRTKLIVLENTHNRCGGVPLTLEYTRAVGRLAKSEGLALHLDGARIFNAAIALEVAPRELAEPADSVMFCLSKGLCAPVGSVLCGSHEFIGKARKVRKQLGGGMRQAGVLAAAGLVALDRMVDRLEEDHHNALMLARGLADIRGIRLYMDEPRTNMVFVDLEDSVPFTAAEVAGRLWERGVRVGPVAERGLRLVTHYPIGEAEIATTISEIERLLAH